jgi:hypothetical protein
MRNLLLLSLILIFISPYQDKAVSDDGSLVVVLGSKWSKSRHKIEKAETAATVAPAAAMTAADRNFERNRRINDPAGARDPNADTLDARSAALEKIVQEARSPKTKIVDGFSYRAKIQNASKKVIEIVFWEYQFKEKANPQTVGRRQFLCAVNIKPDKEKELLGLSLSGPSNVISVESLANKSGNLFDEKVVINRVEYTDGSIWQRRDWNFAEIKATFERAVGTPWGAEMCRGL